MSDFQPWLADLGIINTLGKGKDAVGEALFSAVGCSGREPAGLKKTGWGRAPVFGCDADLESLDAGPANNRVNQLLVAALDDMKAGLSAALRQWSPSRIGVVIGSTDNGAAMALSSMNRYKAEGCFPDGYSLEYQSAHNPAWFIRNRLGLKGPAMALSTACSSSAIALVCARELLETGLCDAVIAGGADIVSRAVYLGFNALEAVAPDYCRPFSVNRSGITLGEGAALFLVCREPFPLYGGVNEESPVIRMLGAGESSDAYHMTAPHPEGTGAEKSMQRALNDAGLTSKNLDYLNLHGTGTELNDAMESRAVSRLFPEALICSSTKGLTGHTLGAAGAMEAGFCWLTLRRGDGRMPAHRWDGEQDPDLPELRLAEATDVKPNLRTAMSNSFAFGGNNSSLILGRDG